MNSCCNLNSEDNGNDILIQKLIREVKKLQDDTTAKLLIQDGKIAETCVYIKDNLSNELRILLDTLQNSGELDDIITSTILGAIEILQSQVEFPEKLSEAGAIYLQYPYGHVKRYGAVGDGITDDTEAISICAENCRNFGFELSADPGEYLISSDINLRYIKIINFLGNISGDHTILIGGSSADGSGHELNFKTLKNLRIIGLKNSLISFLSCDKMSIFADGDVLTDSSTAYCQISGGYCREIDINSVGENIGWINENVFRIKRIEVISMNGNYPHNNNNFEHCNLERGVLNFYQARNNYISARCEGGVIVNTDEAQANFIEREYYYRHYFGENVIEDDKGTLTFYPVNKLQTERALYKLDRYNKLFPIGSLLFNADGTFSGKDYFSIFRSNLIKIDNTFALKMKSDSSSFRVQLNFYDANKNRIYDEVENFADGKMSYIGSGEWSYAINTNVNNDTVSFFPGTAKYVEYRVIFGDGSEIKNIEYVSIKLLKYINTDIYISNTLENNVYTAVPDSGYWERGQKLYAKNPTPGTYIGIICVESGSPGVWKNFAQIME